MASFGECALCSLLLFFFESGAIRRGRPWYADLCRNDGVDTGLWLLLTVRVREKPIGHIAFYCPRQLPHTAKVTSCNLGGKSLGIAVAAEELGPLWRPLCGPYPTSRMIFLANSKSLSA